MSKPRKAASPCTCLEIGQDGTPKHRGERVWVVYMAHLPIRWRNRTPACENHLPNYKRAGWRMAGQSNQEGRFKKEMAWGRKNYV